MENIKQIAVWMDHSKAQLMEYKNDTIIDNSILSDFTHEDKIDIMGKGEKHMHNKEQHEQSEYYKKLSGIIKNYNEVLLFGPTEAKKELLNIIKADPLLKNIKIEIKHSDKMTDNQIHAFVREYFK
jgi:hypothetical protein